MAKLRKMLGDIQSPQCVALMRLIETQSVETLADWAVGYAQQHYLPIYAQACPGDRRLEGILTGCQNHLRTGGKLAQVKPLLKEAAQIGRESEESPVAQAAARAIATACSTLQSPTGALGFLFYGAAATAYSQAGLEQNTAAYNQLAAQELDRALASLEQAAIPGEANPAKINWNC